MTETLRDVIDLPTVDPDGLLCKARRRIPPLVIKPGARGKVRLKDAQVLALYSALMLERKYEHGGLFANIGVGHGKTVIGLTLSRLLELSPAVYLIPARTEETVKAETRRWRRHLKLDGELYVLRYSQLSAKQNSTILDELAPRIIIADEAHRLKNLTGSNRAIRVFRYLKENPECRFCAMSGTMTNRLIDDFAHLAAAALRDHLFLPVDHWARDQLSKCVDEESQGWPTRDDWWDMQVLVDRFAEQPRKLVDIPIRKRREVVRNALHERMRRTPGVVMTQSASCDASIYAKRVHDIAIPDTVHEALKCVDKWLELPNGYEIADGMHSGEAKRQLLQGFCYYYEWPNGQPDLRWLDARRQWGRGVRAVRRFRLKHLDSPGLIKDRIVDGTIDEFATTPARRRAINEAIGAWDVWEVESRKPEPPQRRLWVSNYFVQQVLNWHRKNPRGLIWLTHREVAEKLSKKMLVIPPGEEPPTSGSKGFGLSLGSHREGLNLQAHEKMLFPMPISNAEWLEQACGRIHRQGFKGDAVELEFWCHHPTLNDAVDKAIDRARRIQSMMKQPQKLLLADWSS